MTCPKCQCLECRTAGIRLIIRKHFPAKPSNDNTSDREQELLRRIAIEMMGESV